MAGRFVATLEAVAFIDGEIDPGDRDQDNPGHTDRDGARSDEVAQRWECAAEPEHGDHNDCGDDPDEEIQQVARPEHGDDETERNGIGPRRRSRVPSSMRKPSEMKPNVWSWGWFCCPRT